MVCGLVLTSVYKGSITAMLMLPKITIPIDSIDDLAAQEDIPWKVEFGAQKILLDSGNPSMQKVAAGTQGFITTCWLARHDIGAGKFASLCDATSIATIMSWDFSSTGRCHFYMSRSAVFSGYTFTMAFRKNSSLLPKANHIAMMLTEAGLWDAWLAHQLSNTSECLKPPVADSGKGVRPLSLQDMLGVLTMLELGLTLATLALIAEVLMARSWDKLATPPD